jgi:Putative zinc-finger
LTHTQAVDSMATERYLLGEMTDTERLAFEDHFFGCAECAEEVRLAALMANGARAGLARDAGAAPIAGRPLAFPTARRWRASVVLPYAAAAGLALVVGYQAVELRTLGRHGGGALALAPATLRPATRGEEPVVHLGDDGSMALAVDLGAAVFERGLQYELREVDGPAVATGHAAAPAEGAPLLLFVPGGAAHPLRRYALTIRDAVSGAAAPPFVFTVKAQ